MTTNTLQKIGEFLGQRFAIIENLFAKKIAVDIINEKIDTEKERAQNVENSISNTINNIIDGAITVGNSEYAQKIGNEEDYLDKTGTPSSTWQLSMPNGPKLKNSGGIFELRNKEDNSYANMILQDIVIKGDITQGGDAFITNAEIVEVKDNTIFLNKGETGSGVTKGIAGVEIDRGTEPDYKIIFDETDDRFKAGKDNDLSTVMLRDDDPDLEDGLFLSWDAATKRAKTTNIIPSGKHLKYNGSGALCIETYNRNNSLMIEWHSTLSDVVNSLDAAPNSRAQTMQINTSMDKFAFLQPIYAPSFYNSDGNEVAYKNELGLLASRDELQALTAIYDDGSSTIYNGNEEKSIHIPTTKAIIPGADPNYINHIINKDGLCIISVRYASMVKLMVDSFGVEASYYLLEQYVYDESSQSWDVVTSLSLDENKYTFGSIPTSSEGIWRWTIIDKFETEHKSPLFYLNIEGSSRGNKRFIPIDLEKGYSYYPVWEGSYANVVFRMLDFTCESAKIYKVIEGSPDEESGDAWSTEDGKYIIAVFGSQDIGKYKLKAIVDGEEVVSNVFTIKYEEPNAEFMKVKNVHIVTDYPQDLSSYADGSIFIKQLI